MLEVRTTSKMRRDIKRMSKRGKNMSKLADMTDLLAAQKPVPEQHRDHQLEGNMKEYRECHIEPDWLLVYRVFKDELILLTSRTGTHSDLFKE